LTRLKKPRQSTALYVNTQVGPDFRYRTIREAGPDILQFPKSLQGRRLARLTKTRRWHREKSGAFIPAGDAERRPGVHQHPTAGV
jgi:hypothetical protein